MTKVTVAAALCAPIRNQVLTALQPYGVVVNSITSRKINGSAGMPLFQEATIDFNPQAAKWAEYVLVRSDFRLVSKPLDKRNPQWAAKWDGPPKPWTQKGCTDAKSPRQVAPAVKRKVPARPVGMFGMMAAILLRGRK